MIWPEGETELLWGLSNLDQEDLDQIVGQVTEELRKAADGEDDFVLYLKVGAYGVVVSSQPDEHTCDTCLDHDRTHYTLYEAKEKKPIPHDACENEECRRSYLPVPGKETFEENKKGPGPDLSTSAINGNQLPIHERRYSRSVTPPLTPRGPIFLPWTVS